MIRYLIATPLALVLLVCILLLMAQLIQPKISTQAPVENIITIDFIRVTPFEPQTSRPETTPPDIEIPPKEAPPKPAPPITKTLLLPNSSPSFKTDTISLPKAQFTTPTSLSDLIYDTAPQLPTKLTPLFTENLFPLHTPQPMYPRRARSRGIQGWVKVGFTIQPSGKVKDIVILSAEPAGIFDNTTRRSVAEWTFKPQLLDGKPSLRRVEQTIRFNLQK